MIEEKNDKKYLSQTTKRFIALEKVEISTLTSKLVSMQLYNAKWNIREYIMEVLNLVTRLRPLKLEFSYEILVYLILISLLT